MVRRPLASSELGGVRLKNAGRALKSTSSRRTMSAAAPIKQNQRDWDPLRGGRSRELPWSRLDRAGPGEGGLNRRQLFWQQREYLDVKIRDQVDHAAVWPRMDALRRLIAHRGRKLRIVPELDQRVVGGELRSRPSLIPEEPKTIRPGRGAEPVQESRHDFEAVALGDAGLQVEPYVIVDHVRTVRSRNCAIK